MAHLVDRQSKNRQFSHAAAAMGAFWAGARKNEAQRIEKLRQMLFGASREIAATPPEFSAAGPAFRHF